jgi:ABC-type oligopeptide transport system substrate-binding subunit
MFSLEPNLIYAVRPDTSEEHLGQIRELLAKIVPSDVFFEDKEDFLIWAKGSLPLLQWIEPSTTPEELSIIFFCSSSRELKIESLFIDLIRTVLIPDKETPILSFRHMQFSFQGIGENSFSIIEAKILIESTRELHYTAFNLALLKKELALALSCPAYSKHLLLSKKGHQSFSKASLIHQDIIYLIRRFSKYVETSILDEMSKFLVLASTPFLNQHQPHHLTRIIGSIYLLRKSLFRAVALSPTQRHLNLRCIPTKLIFPFCTKPVLGFLIGINILDKYERFEEEHVLLAIKKLVPETELINGSVYCHTLPSEGIKIFYLEVAKKDSSAFSLVERRILKQHLGEKLKSSVERLIPSIFMVRNEEEVLRNILTLRQEIRFLQDLPQVMISFDYQTLSELVFFAIIVRIGRQDFFQYLKQNSREILCLFERIQIVDYLDKNHPIEANVLKLHLPKDSSLLRGDSSFNFYLAREKIASLLYAALGDFRDYNGGIIIKQGESLSQFKRHFQRISTEDTDLIENFFYSLTPIETQATLPASDLNSLFELFLETLESSLPHPFSYAIQVKQIESKTYLSLRTKDLSIRELLTSLLEPFSSSKDLICSTLIIRETISLNYIYTHSDVHQPYKFLHVIEKALSTWKEKRTNLHILQLPVQFPMISMDPRLGGEEFGSNILRLLFEGLTRINKEGKIEYGVAQSVTISSDRKHYIFKLREAHWNNRSLVTAHDFEYAWKKILSPSFKTPFSYVFYPIKNAKCAKEGALPLDQVGIQAIDDSTLKIELEFPAPYFLELTAHILYSPINQMVDQLHPNWPFQTGDAYVCNGAFQLNIHSSQGYELVRNPHYWDIENIRLDQVLLHRLTSYQAYQLFQQGELDWLGNPFGSWSLDFKAKEKEKIISSKGGVVSWYVFNTQRFPFSHSKLRQAFSLAIDRTELIKDFQTYVDPAYSPLLPGHSQVSTDISTAFNLDPARQLFKEALSELNLTVDTFPMFSLFYLPGGFRDIAAKNLQSQWLRAFSIHCRIEALEWDLLFPRLTEGNYDMGNIFWTSPIDDPIYTLNAFRFASEGTNFSKWENSDYQKLLDKADYEINTSKRLYYLAQAEKLLLEQVPVLPAYYPESRALVKNHLQNISFKPASAAIDLKWIVLNDKSLSLDS